MAQVEADNDEKLDVFEVTYTWKQTISAETEEDTIAIARNKRISHGCVKDTSETYTVERAEFMSESIKPQYGLSIQ